eukprot:m.5217 g.5217  ORF g.5217 m.5217 type:complete len:236 (+) comp5361_c0_seq1:103-810(+)
MGSWIPTWLNTLQAALVKNLGCYEANYLALATVKTATTTPTTQPQTQTPVATPAVRLVVFRGWLAGETVYLPNSFFDAKTTPRLTSLPAPIFTTDSRSAKVAQLQAQPAAEVCWYLPKTRQQFRLTGRVELLPHSSPQSLAVWSQLSDGTRSAFLQPAFVVHSSEHTGPEPTTSNSSSPQPNANQPTIPKEPPETFLVGVLHVNHVDELELVPKNKRTKHELQQDGTWVSQEVWA